MKKKDDGYANHLALLKKEVRPPAIGIFEAVDCSRREGEDCFKTAERLLIEEAMHRESHIAKRAADLLGVTSRVMCYRLREAKHPAYRGRSNEPELVTDLDDQLAGVQDREENIPFN